MKGFFKVIGMGIILAFAGIGFLFSAVFVAMQFDLLNVRGSIDDRNEFFLNLTPTEDRVASPDERPFSSADSVAVQLEDNSCIDKKDTCSWDGTREWQVVAGGLAKDADIIARVADETEVPARLIASVVVPEQIRFFTANREIFKRYFEPLKILGSLSKFSLGVSGIKQETATAVEKYANDPGAAFYPGEGYAPLLAYQTGVDTDTELFRRLTNEKDHYYSYLYTAVFIKEILAQWDRAGFQIADDPAVVATIFNLGFSGSKPKTNPQVGGTTIAVGGTNYAFGALAARFYNSEELLHILP